MSRDQTAALVERITLEADLRNALVTGDLVLRYQPIVDLATGRTIAFETLCRWRHWSRGLLGPAAFMPLAEQTGLIVPLGGWVMQEACRRLELWRQRLPVGDSLDVTVNLSPTELRDRDLVDRVTATLEASGLPAERLILEVNQAAVSAEAGGPAARNLAALADLGVGLAADDIDAPPDLDGWLWQLPVRLLKVGRGVTATVAADPGAARVFASTVRAAADRGVPAVAKGVETPDQLAHLYRARCPAGQGFLFARPMDPADAEAYLRRFVRAERVS